MKVILTAIVTFCLTALLFMPFVTFPDERESKETKMNSFTGNVTDKDCHNTLGFGSYMTVEQSKFSIEYKTCQSINKGSTVEVKYADDLKVKSIIYK